MTEKEKIDAAVAKAVADAEAKAKAEREEAVAKAREEAAADAKAEAEQLARADADEAIAKAKADAQAEADERVKRAQEDAARAIEEARESDARDAEEAAAAARAGMKHYVLIETSFIGGSLLAPGSRVTSVDLGTYTDPTTGTVRPVKPGETLVEVHEDGSPVDRASADKLRAVAGDVAGIPIAAVQPFSPNPTRPQGAPTQPPGGVSLVEGALRTQPPQGVESNEAAQARADQAGNAAQAVAAMTAGEKPRRRGSSG